MILEGYTSITPGTIDLYVWYTTGSNPSAGASTITVTAQLNGAGTQVIATGAVTPTIIASQTNHVVDIYREYIEKNNRQVKVSDQAIINVAFKLSASLGATDKLRLKFITSFVTYTNYLLRCKFVRNDDPLNE
jgi:hypothetical protein